MRILLAMLLSVNGAASATYYIDRTHGSASDGNPGTSESAPWQNISKANSTLVAGDTVQIKAAAYNGQIAPANNGTSGSRITYMRYGSDIVTITGQAPAMQFTGDRFITVDGINATNCDTFCMIEGASSNIWILNCSFKYVKTFSSWAGSRIWEVSHHCIVSNSVFSNYGACSADDEGTLLEIGYDSDTSGAQRGDYNLIVSNQLFSVGHHTLGVNGNHNVILGNSMWNQDAFGTFGNRTMYLNGDDSYNTNNLVEGNRIGYSDVPCDSWGAPGMQMSSDRNIVRRNQFFFNNLAALLLSTEAAYDSGANYNHIYNNSFHTNGFQLDSGSDDPQRSQITFMDNSGTFTVISNMVKNNCYDGAPQIHRATGASLANQVFANNYDGNTSGHPLYNNASSPGTPSDQTYPDLHLQAASPARDYGGALTTITSASSSGTSFTVDDPWWFMDGWGLIAADQIQLIGQTTAVRITAINYGTKTLTVDQSVTWTQGVGIALPFAGSAPDAGAFEFESSSAIVTARTGVGDHSSLRAR